ncbi:MAG: type II secretion system major pseudopilin GspG, partial [Phenylobacterium sp.]
LPSQDRAMHEKARADVATLETALETYRMENTKYPSNDQGLGALTADRQGAGGYVRRLPKDPWGNAYQYAYPGEHGRVDVYSFGADGRKGGEGEDADIGNWS